MQSRSIVSWLQQNSGEFYTVTTWYFTNREKNQYHSYLSHRLDGRALTKKLAESKNLPDQQAVVSHLDTVTGQNALHFILSNKIYGTKCWKQEFCAVSNWSQFEKLGGQKSYIQAEDVHDVLISEKCAKPVKDFVAEEFPKLIEALISPYSKDDEGLRSLLLEKDKKGDTPLHCAMNSFKHLALLQPLVERIKTLPIAYKKEIALAKDKSGKNIYHRLFARWQNNFGNAIFGMDVTHSALLSQDNNCNTLLHTACYSTRGRLRKVKFICKALNPPAYDEKSEHKSINLPETALDYLFQQNTGGLNPLHLACKNKTNDEQKDTKVVSTLKAAADKLFVAKLAEQDIKGCTPVHYAVQSGNVSLLMELLTVQINLCQQDEKGFTPLHYAIQSGNPGIVRELLKKLSVEEKTALARIPNKNKETALDFACSYGNRDILEVIIQALGADKFYLIRKEISDKHFEKLIANNPRLTKQAFSDCIIKYNSIFEGADYIFSNINRICKGEKNAVMRGKDFQSCTDSLENNRAFPAENKEFLPHRYLFGQQGTARYHSRRIFFTEESRRSELKKELGECKEFVKGLPANKMACQILNLNTKSIGHLFEMFGLQKADKTEESEVTRIEPSAPEEEKPGIYPQITR